MSYEGYETSTVKNQLDGGVPVIMRGQDIDISSIHAWVCDGY